MNDYVEIDDIYLFTHTRRIYRSQSSTSQPARAALLRSEFFPIVIYSENHQSDVHFKVF